MKRVRLAEVRVGDLVLEVSEAHHARDVLRMREGDGVEVFDAAGRSAGATLVSVTQGQVVVRVERLNEAPARKRQWTIAAAVPKGNRADWMVEKLAELGTGRFIPLLSERSVVAPEGKNKIERWGRIAEEASKQSRRVGVMEIGAVTELAALVGEVRAGRLCGKARSGPTWYCSTEIAGEAAVSAALALSELDEPLALVGPEGGWAPGELSMFVGSGFKGVSLGATILRVETAALAMAAILAAGVCRVPRA